MTVENPYILGHEVHITSRLNVTILYISFLGGGRGIEKYQIWPQNKNIRYPFYQKKHVRDENRTKINVSCP
jgi:hypothetical protein